jgi:hypothetical protein
VAAALPADRGATATAARRSAAEDARAGSAAGGLRRKSLVFTAVIGAALVVMPVAFQMFQRAPKGASMLAQFKPFMTTARLDGYQHEIAVVGAGIAEVDASAGPYLQTHGAITQPVTTAYPTYGTLAAHWPAIDSKMTTLLDEVQGNLGNYKAVAALPSFDLFPWFFVLPGMIVLGGALGLLLRPARRALLMVLVVVGIGLVAAPAAFDMFARAPDGAQMMSAFKTIETTNNVVSIQDDFSTMASGQGVIRLDILPALEGSGLSSPRVARQFPALSTLDGSWVHILNDMTPMIGAMSDNVASYQAIAALPSFKLFPWFFVLPGLLIVAGALSARPRRAAPVDAHLAPGETG